MLTIDLCLLLAALMLAGLVMAYLGMHEIINHFWAVVFTVLGLVLFFGTAGLGLVLLFKSPAWLF